MTGLALIVTGGLSRFVTDGLSRVVMAGVSRFVTDGLSRFVTDGLSRVVMAGLVPAICSGTSGSNPGLRMPGRRFSAIDGRHKAGHDDEENAHDAEKAAHDAKETAQNFLRSHRTGATPPTITCNQACSCYNRRTGGRIPGTRGGPGGEHTMMAAVSLACGSLVGFILGLIGGGGSILATPMLLYIVGLEPHVAIGTGALAVSANAFANFGGHARAGNVLWKPALMFSAAGVLGAFTGSSAGKVFDGHRLVFLFAILMIVVGILMLRPRRGGGVAIPAMTPALLARTALIGVGVGLLSGFFGIGGGFLIVPGLILATGMPMLNAVGTSLFGVGVFGLTTAANYASSGLVNWPVAGEFIAGGLIGGILGMKLAGRLAKAKGALNKIFAGVVFVVALYIMWRSLRAGA